MVTSRYDPPASPTAQGTGKVPTNSSTNTSGNQSGTSNTQSSSNTSGSSTTNQETNSRTQTQNMTGESLAALELLIQQLLGGGTQEMAQQRGERQLEINTNRATRSQYDKESAFADAQGLMAQTMRQTLEKVLPTINRAAAGSGTSQGSMRALLTQKAAQEAAEAASAQGLNAAVQYGGLNAQFGSILERLTQQDNTVTNNLLGALNIARGAVTNSQTSGTSTSSTNSDQQTTGTSNTQTQQQNNGASNTTVGPQSSGSNNSNAGNTLAMFGPQQTGPAPTAGSSIDFIQQLSQLAGGSGGNSGWSSQFTF